MPLRFFLILSICICGFPFLGKSHDTTIVHYYLGAHIGGTYNFELENFNNNLLSNSVQSVPEFVFTLGIDQSILFRRSKIAFNIVGQTIQNSAKPPETKILMNCFAFSANYGFDLIGKNENIRLEPFLGFGGSSIELFVTSHDSTATFNQVLNGAQNNYSERSSFGFILDTGLRFELLPKKKDFKVAYFGQCNYQLQLNTHNWNLQGMSLTQLSKLNITFGAKFQLRLPRKRHTTQ